jgi:hypothetical protein
MPSQSQWRGNTTDFSSADGNAKLASTVRSRFTEPVTFASDRTHFLFLMPTAYLIPAMGDFVFFDDAGQPRVTPGEAEAGSAWENAHPGVKA